MRIIDWSSVVCSSDLSFFAESKMLAESGKRTSLFIDEIHRMTKSIQDLLLAPIETGVIVLIGATTEHPAYELNNAIQSRTSVLILKPLETPSLEELGRTSCRERVCP